MATFQEYTHHIMKYGVARTNRFQVLIPIPQKMMENVVEPASQGPSKISELFGEAIKIIKIFTGPSTNEIARGLDIMCNQTELPGKNINISETKYNGDTLKSGHSILYGQHQFTFKMSKDMHEKNIIDAWQNLIIDPETHEVGYHDDYAVPITIFQLDTEDRIVHGVMLVDAFPTMVNPLTLSNAETNNVHELMVQFAYKRWVNLDLTRDDGEEVTRLSQTPLGPFLTPILSNPIVKRALDYVENATGIDLEGEAVNIYNQIDEIVKQTTGESINKTISILNQMKAQIQLNDKITDNQIAQLLDLIDGTLDKIVPGE